MQTNFEDMIYAANLKNKISLRAELEIAELKADFWVISFNVFPVGAVEIKKPGDTKEEDKLVNYGQLFDYMTRIRSFHGLRSVLGIFTNYNEWQICWLSDSDACALSINLEYGRNKIDSDIATKRILHVSMPYSWKDAQPLSHALYSVLCKMDRNSNFVAPVPLLSSSRSYIALDKNKWTWQKVPNVSELSFKAPNRGTENFILLRDFHGGADGRVWLACVKDSGHLAVIKFQTKIAEGKKGDEKNKIDVEVERWHKCGMKSVYAAILSGRHAIVMPFGFHYNSNKTVDDTWWRGESDNPKVKYFDEFFKMAQVMDSATALDNCISCCSQAKLIHEDIETIPESFSSLKNLHNICLDDNILSGTFPSGMKALPILSQISISNNLLSGNIFSSFVSNQLTVFNVANNVFTGSISDDIFVLSTILSAIIASGNCLVGSIPDNVCKVMNIITIFDFSNSGGSSLCLENQHVLNLRPSFVHGTFSQLGLSGTIPSCLMQSSTMTALKLSGNKLEGTISSNPTNISSSLLNLTLANNALTGTIPTWIQLHSFLELDLSNNRLDGTLSSDFTIASDQTTLALAVNRLGPLPHSIVASSANMTSLNVLAGNIFGCNNNDLPALDPSSASYTCGSNDLDISAYTWLVCVGFFVAVTIMVAAAIYWHPAILDLISVRQVLDKVKLWQSSTLMQSRIRNTNSTHNTRINLPEVVSFVLCSKFITIAVLCIASISLFAAFPLFAGLHADYAIVSYDYGYVLSIAYLHGIAPVVVVRCLLAAILLLAAVFIPSLIEHITMLNVGKNTINDSLTMLNFASTLMKDFNWNIFRSYLIFTLLNLINIVVVMSVNVSYVATLSHRVKYNRVELLVIQVSVGLFNVVWNTFYVAWSCDWLASFFTHRGSMRSRYMMSIVNYIIAPVISAIVYNESCFYYVFNNQDQVASSIELGVINYESCNDLDCFQTISINIDSESSSFVYSYACDSALIVAYTPIFFTSALFYGLFQQGVRLLLAFGNPSRKVQAIKNLPKILTAMISKPNSSNDILLTEKSGVRVKGRDIIVRLMVQMTVMLTFGLASPILMIPLTFAVIMDCKVSQLLVGKCIYENDHMQVMNDDSVDIKTTNQNPITDNQPTVVDTISNMPNNVMSDTQPTMKADLLIMEHLDLQSSWQGLDVCFYPMIMFVMLFWEFLFFDMIADDYGTINGIITMTLFATLPSIFFISLLKSKAMIRIISYFGLSRAIDNCIDKISCGSLDIRKQHERRIMDVELTERVIMDMQGSSN